MQTLQANQFFSGTLPGGETVTLHTGNARAFDAGDAAWLLAAYPDRFEVVEDMASVDPVKESETDGGETSEAAPDPTLIKKVVEVPADIEKFGAHARAGKGKGKKG